MIYNPASKIVRYTKLLSKYNYNSIYDGNISFRPVGSGHFYITQSSIRKQQITSKNIMKVRTDEPFDSMLESIWNKYSGISREVIFHQYIIRNIPLAEDSVVIHCHPKHSIAFMGTQPMSMGSELNQIKWIFPEIQLNIAPNVPLVPAGTRELAKEVEFNMFTSNYQKDRYDIIGLEKHGVISVSNSFENALDNIRLLEYYCEISNISNASQLQK